MVLRGTNLVPIPLLIKTQNSVADKVGHVLSNFIHLNLKLTSYKPILCDQLNLLMPP